MMTSNQQTPESHPLTARPGLEWFLANHGNYQGPFSFEQICERLEQGRLGRKELAWRDGMVEWLPLDEISLFSTYSAMAPLEIFSALPDGVDFLEASAVGAASEVETSVSKEEKVAAPVETVTKAAAPAVAAPEASAKISKKKKKAAKKPTPDFEALFVQKMQARRAAQAARRKVEQEKGLIEDVASLFGPPAPPVDFFKGDDSWKKFFDVQYPTLTPEERRAEILRRVKIFVAKRGLAIAAAVAVASAVLFVGSEVIRSAHASELNDVSREENSELRAAMASHPDGGKPLIAIAKSTIDSFAPVFYVGSHLVDGTRLDILIEGRPETLVERLRVSVHALVTVKEGLARTPPFRQENGQPYPRGEYRIAVSCSGCDATKSQSAIASQKKLSLGEKVYFLGGVKNQEYDQKLKSHHDAVRAQAKEEVNELKQVVETLETQAKESAREFAVVLGAVRMNPKALKTKSEEWSKFDRQWIQLQSQMTELFARWTPETLEANYFHANLYNALKKVGDRVGQFHQAQTSRMTSEAALLAPDAPRVSEISTIMTELKTIRAKIKNAEELPATSTGMPQHVSL